MLLNKKAYIIFLCLLYATIHCVNPGAHIDVVIPACQKDLRTLDMAIAGIRQHCKNVRRIIVVSEKQMTLQAEWFDEARYPFTKKDLLLRIFANDTRRAAAYGRTPKNRTGWIYQQFLKLYAAFVIPDIADTILILDADTIFLNDVEFIDDDGRVLYNASKEYIQAYFDFAQRLLPGFKKIHKAYSGVCHHMVFERSVLERLFQEIEAVHHC